MTEVSLDWELGEMNSMRRRLTTVDCLSSAGQGATSRIHAGVDFSDAFSVLFRLGYIMYNLGIREIGRMDLRKEKKRARRVGRGQEYIVK